ncbi:MAG: aminoacyl-tRNA hydrolase [Patescibacteria group bacterium]
MELIIGLGNPGKKYEKTRHNLGFLVINELAEKMEMNNWKIKMQFNANIAQGNFKNEKIILAKPQTFMNNSGMAIKSIVDYYKIPNENIFIIHDDIDLLLGEIKVQKNRSSAGHKGVQSIINALGTKDFIRVRLGIKSIDQKTIIDTEKFVLQKFSKDEEKIVQEIIIRAAGLITAAL